MGRLAGKTALVTGVTSGLGREIALRLAGEGATLIGTGRNWAEGEKTIEQITALGGRAAFHTLEITSESGWADLYAMIEDRHGRIDIAVNNAGAFFSKSIPDTTPADFQWLWRINVEGCFLGTKFAVSHMEATGGSGAIVNVSSLAALIGLEDSVTYCATKAAVNMISKSAAVETARRGSQVRVNALCPGVIWTELIYKAYGDTPEARKFCVDGNALPLLGQPRHIADGVFYLVSDTARHVTGTTLVIDGGRGAD